jgi:hypothetical protein
MHRRPGGGRFIPSPVPAGFNLFRCLSVIFTGGLIEPHFFDNRVRVKRGKMRMEPGGDREIVAIACAGIFVGTGVEFDESVARVGIHFLIYVLNK